MQNFKSICDEADFEAEKAAREWLEAATARGPAFSVHSSDIAGNTGPAIGYMLDNCGGAIIFVRDKRKPFAKWLKANPDRSWGWDHGGRPSVTVNYSLRGRQEMGLHEAAKRAALNVFSKHGVAECLSYYSYID